MIVSENSDMLIVIKDIYYTLSDIFSLSIEYSTSIQKNENLSIIEFSFIFDSDRTYDWDFLKEIRKITL